MGLTVIGDDMKRYLWTLDASSDGFRIGGEERIRRHRQGGSPQRVHALLGRAVERIQSGYAHGSEQEGRRDPQTVPREPPRQQEAQGARRRHRRRICGDPPRADGARCGRGRRFGGDAGEGQEQRQEVPCGHRVHQGRCAASRPGRVLVRRHSRQGHRVVPDRSRGRLHGLDPFPQTRGISAGHRRELLSRHLR